MAQVLAIVREITTDIGHVNDSVDKMIQNSSADNSSADGLADLSEVVDLFKL